MYVIQSAGSQSDAHVIDPHTNAVLTFPTRKAARAYADSIVPEMPSKCLPLRVREVLA